MSTTSSTTLGKSAQMRISHAWDEITQHLPVPGYAWRWGETGLSHETLYRLKAAGLIEPSTCGDRWETTRELWRYVIERAGDDETVGSSTGQELLDAPGSASGASRVLTDPSPPSRGGARQATLTGDTATLNDVDELSTNKRKRNPHRDGDEDAGDVEGQLSASSALLDAVERNAGWTSPREHSSTTFSA